MPPPYCYDYPRPSVTVDMVVFRLAGDELQVLLIRRGRDPFAGHWALPGGFLDIDEPVIKGARRELMEETGLKLAHPPAFLGVYGAPGRDPRGRTFSMAHLAVVREPHDEVVGRDDAAEAAWRVARMPRPETLAFDHNAILADALDRLVIELRTGELGLAQALLPVEFEEVTARSLFRAVGGSTGGALAWIRRMEGRGLIRPIEAEPRRYRQVKA